MSIGSMGAVAASVAGTQLAQAKGTDTERAQHAANVQQRQVQSSAKAEAAAGIGETDGQDHEASERDADGRMAWQMPAHQAADESADSPPVLPKDPSGAAGNLLDLSG